MDHLCECGCGQVVKWSKQYKKRNRFVLYHGKRTEKYWSQFENPPLCACGCGEKVKWDKPRRKWNRYVHGHAIKDRVITKETRLKMSAARQGIAHSEETKRKMSVKRTIDMTGQVFGRLTVIKQVESKGKQAMWLCKCSCGNYKSVSGGGLRGGRQHSCGCLLRERISTLNGLSIKYKREHKTWNAMKRRCLNPKAPDYERYGGAGIKVVDRWINGFENFLNDMGERPEGKTLDRIDNNGDYTPENCKWSTDLEQKRNTSYNIWYLYKGEKLIQAEMVRKLGVSDGTIKKKYKAWRII